MRNLAKWSGLLAISALLTWGSIQIIGSPTDPGAIGLSPENESAGVASPQHPTRSNTQNERVVGENHEVPAGATVSGTVRRFDGQPLKNVSIRVEPSFTRPSRDEQSLLAQNTTSTIVGEFAVRAAVNAEYILSFDHRGYRPHRIRVRAPTTGLQVILERSPRLGGRVVGPGGLAISGALVRWSQPRDNSHGVTTTDIDGRFIFSSVPRALDIEVRAPGMLPFHRFLKVYWDMGEVLITMDNGAESSGSVVDGDSGAGIAGASVSLWYYQSTYSAEGRRGGTAQRAETVKTLSDGSFTLTKARTATRASGARAWIWVTAPGRAPHWKEWQISHSKSGTQIRLYRTASVRGRVVDMNGRPVSGQRVYAEASVQALCDAGSNRGYRKQEAGLSVAWNSSRPNAVAPFHAEREAFTNDAGEYVIHNIPSVDAGCKILIALPAGRPLVEIVARPGDCPVAEDLVRPAHLFQRWHGIIIDRNRRPVPGALVHLATVKTLSDVDGRFALEVPGNLQGELLMRVRASGFVPARRRFAPDNGGVAACADGGVTISLERATPLKALVVDSLQKPVADASLKVYANGELASVAQGGRIPTWLNRGFSNDTGLLRIEGAPSICDILVESNRHNAKTRRILLGVAPDAGLLRVVLDKLDLRAQATSLIVAVRDAHTGGPYVGPFTVALTTQDYSARRRGSNGEISIKSLPLGSYDIFITAESLGPVAMQVDLFQDRRIEVTLGQGIDVSGLVNCTTGALVEPVEVSVRKLVKGSPIVTVQTDKNGHFHLAGMAPGKYAVTVEPFKASLLGDKATVRTAQRYASTMPREVSIRAGEQLRPIKLPVTRVEPLRVIVNAGKDVRVSHQVWAWAQELQFSVKDGNGHLTYSGGPSDIMASSAMLLIQAPTGSYTINVQHRGTPLGNRKLAAGKSWTITLN